MKKFNIDLQSPSPLLLKNEELRQKVKECRGHYRQLAQATGISLSWIEKFSGYYVRCAGIDMISKLEKHFSHSKQEQTPK